MENTKDIEIVETEGNDSQLREAEAEACGNGSFAGACVAGAMWMLMLAGWVAGAVMAVFGY